LQFKLIAEVGYFLYMVPMTVTMTVPSVLLHCWFGVGKNILPVKKLSDEVLVWLSAYSKVQTVCIWSS